jgi:hypothetical protein
MEEKISLPLRKSITLGIGDKAVTVTSIELREPIAGELEISSRADTNVGALITLLGIASGKGRPLIEQFSRGDLVAAETALDSLSLDLKVDVPAGVEEFTLTLVKPITIGNAETGISVTTLDLRPPVAVELERAARADTGVGTTISIIQQVSKVPRTAIEKLSRTDFRAAQSVIDSFTEGGPQTPADGNG